MKIESHTFPNFGYLIIDLPKPILLEIAQEIDQIRHGKITARNYSDRLVADIADSYELIHSKPAMNAVIPDLIRTYDSSFPGYTTTQDKVSSQTPVGIHDMWVNIQKPGEINPNHSHFGIFSFVIWMLVPYTAEEQHAGLPGAPVRGLFEFSYTQTNGNINHVAIQSDKNYQGKCCFFPSSMQHCVYPFKSVNLDDRRITVSGNIRYLV